MKSNIRLYNGLLAFTSDFGAILVALASVATVSAQTNTKTGTSAGLAITSGVHNTANGYSALKSDKTGSFNTAIGSSALLKSTGASNVAVGFEALGKNTTGSLNVAVGDGALRSNTSGSGNIGIGEDAGINLTTGRDNICIDHKGVAGESAKIRIGTPGVHTDTYLAGVIRGNGSGLTGVTGLLGPIGPQGPVGQRGADGVAGAAGSAGQQGVPGSTGPQGNPGPSGPQGPAGAAGGAAVFPNGMKEFATPNVPGAPYTFTVPAGVSRIMVEVWGAGGGGGGGYNVRNPYFGGASGGAGAYSRKFLDVISGQIFNVTIGEGGVNGNMGTSDIPTTLSTPGIVGGKSEFIAEFPNLQKVISEGGGGGAGATANDSVACVGGIGGIADPAAVIGRTTNGLNGKNLSVTDFTFGDGLPGGLAFTQVPVGPPVGACNGGSGGVFVGNANPGIKKGGDGYVLITW